MPPPTQTHTRSIARRSNRALAGLRRRVHTPHSVLPRLDLAPTLAALEITDEELLDDLLHPALPPGRWSASR